ncbi:hypothetical protein N7468_010612 [Penicillium chermesinum]|uniref:Uncharacterized protein n=1 Tax=Penicillium chermesinum TaxID=63820 RepID=A0A9W9N801_9EURO|nr:uncharacterized protein N7468_010612 [Penicillium chermesinum]KAJ5214933.1 hypothetical protein N7468_010612 [Penicillium chermesinum]KAJ6141564.1 hypothetical protein N7470_009954 [Penicillium chermesinum]
MLFSTLIASAIAFGMVSAAPTPATPANTRYAQLRLFGAPGCLEQNQGELGVYGDYVNTCNPFDYDFTVKSVSFEYAINNCTVQVFSDSSCQTGAIDIALDSCSAGDNVYGSYEVHCAHL